MKIRRVRWTAALLAASLAGCDGLVGSNGDEVQREQFAFASGRWAAADVSSYSYVLTLICECGTEADLRPVRVTVEDGAVVSRVYESNDSTQRTPAPEAIFGPYDTVEELFVAVENSIGKDSDLLNVAYDPEYGVPLLLQWDRDSSDPDDNLVFQVVGFAPAAGS